MGQRLRHRLQRLRSSNFPKCRQTNQVHTDYQIAVRHTHRHYRQQSGFRTSTRSTHGRRSGLSRGARVLLFRGVRGGRLQPSARGVRVSAQGYLRVSEEQDDEYKAEAEQCDAQYGE